MCWWLEMVKMPKMISKDFYLSDETATMQWGQTLSAYCRPGMVIYLLGNLGAGKTTLARGLLRGLGISERIKSPSYTLLESYELERFTVFHFDFYRISSAESLRDIGIEQYFTGTDVCIIEWPEHGLGVIPAADLTVTLTWSAEQSGRQCQVQGHGTLGEGIVKQLG